MQIKSYLKQMAQTKKPHEAIPSEAQLSAMFKVSRGTVKQAIMDLVYEGMLYREQGKGTFVAPQKITRSFDRLPSFTDDIRKTGCDACSHLLTLAQISPSDSLCRVFHLQPTEAVVKVKRLVLMEENPIVVVTSYLNPHVYPSLRMDELGDSLYEALQKKYGIIPVKAQDTYSIVDVSPKTAELLKCRKTDSVCYSQRVAYLASGLAVEYVESFIRSNRFKLDICIGMEMSADAPHGSEEPGTKGTPHYDVGFRNVIL